MSAEAWIGLATVLLTIGSAIVALAMAIASLRSDARNRHEWIKSEVQSRKDADRDLEEQLKQERGDRIKRDSDLFREISKIDHHVRRWERRQIELGRRPPSDTPDESDEDLKIE